MGRLRTYYIAFSGQKAPSIYVGSWAIRNTENDLDTAAGLLAEIEALDSEKGYPIRIEYWKKIKGGKAPSNINRISDGNGNENTK